MPTCRLEFWQRISSIRHRKANAYVFPSVAAGVVRFSTTLEHLFAVSFEMQCIEHKAPKSIIIQTMQQNNTYPPTAVLAQRTARVSINASGKRQ